MFDQIANRYDIANHLLSFGTHLLWKKQLVKEAFNKNPLKVEKMLDIACGTGDILELANRNHPSVVKVGLDPSSEMLKKARQRFKDVEHVYLIRGNAENLPFKGESFELITVSFGVRNFQNRKKAFENIFRTLKRGGIFAILEFAKPDNGNLLQHAAWCYTKNFVPFAGALITNQKEAYQYLVKSIERFPLPNKLLLELKEVGFSTLMVKRVFPPIAVLYILQKP